MTNLGVTYCTKFLCTATRITDERGFRPPRTSHRCFPTIPPETLSSNSQFTSFSSRFNSASAILNPKDLKARATSKRYDVHQELCKPRAELAKEQLLQ